jgi:hypothetical protein
LYVSPSGFSVPSVLPLIYLADDEDAREFEVFSGLLDTETPNPSTGLKVSVPAIGPQTELFDFSFGFERGDSVESLKKRYSELEQDTHRLADKLNQSTSLSESERGELLAAVRKSFEARQTLQRAELADLARRMQSMQQSIAMRDKLADKVVKRRVEDLLNPNLKWGAGQFSGQPLASSSEGSDNSAMLLPKSPAQLHAIAPYYAGERPTTVIRRNFQGRWIVHQYFDGNENSMADLVGQLEVEIDGNTLRYKVGKEYLTGPILLADSNDPQASQIREDGTFPIDFIYEPNGDSETHRGIMAFDGATLSICLAKDCVRPNDDFRPSLFAPGPRVSLLKCRRAENDNNATRQFATPEELLNAVEQYDQGGAYEAFITLFSDEGVRDLAGSLLMSAVMQTNIDELVRQHPLGGLSEVDPGTVAVRKVLQRWLPQSVSAAQQEAMGKGLSMMMNSMGGVSPDPTAVQEFIASTRNGVKGIADHRKFCVEIMQALESRIKEPYRFFGKIGQNPEWQISQSGERSIATLIDGSPGMPTTITLQQASGTWRISSVFNELVHEPKPTIDSQSATAPEQPNPKTVTRQYSVGSFITETFFTGKGSYDLKEVYDRYETEIERSLQDLAKTVSSACIQPPKFVQILSDSRSLLVGHTEAGHQEIASFMRDIGINNDRIRLRGVWVEITQDEAKKLGIELAQHGLLAEEVRFLLEFANGETAKSSKVDKKQISGDTYIEIAGMDESIPSGVRTPLKQNRLPIPVTIAARIVPGAKQIQIRLDMFGLGNEKTQYVSPRFQTLTDGQSVLFWIADDHYWLATADIVRDAMAGAVDAYKQSASSSLRPDAELSTPQSTLDYMHRYSLAHPGGFPAECYTDEAILELSGMMLQNLAMMSAMSQIAVQAGGVIGASDGVPVVSEFSPAFHIQVDALLIAQMLPTPPEHANKAFEMLAKLTFENTSSNAKSLIKVDRHLIRLAAGVLRSPKEFLPLASKLLTTFGENDADVTKSKKATQKQPNAKITVNGDEATATFISGENDSAPSPFNSPRVTKLRRIDGRWLISEILTDEEISQMQSSLSSVMDLFAGAKEVTTDKSTTSGSTQPKDSSSAVGPSKAGPLEWNDFLKLLPERGTALAMFSYEPETKEQMLLIAKKVAQAASAQLIELPQTTWHKVIAPPATHFVLIKDRQLVGTRTGLMTESRLQEFVAKAKDWLTPQATGVDEKSLVRIDCYINPGPDNVGSQHGGAYPLTSAVIAVHEDQALLFGPDSIADYIEKGYSCVAVVRDAVGNPKQLPLDVLHKGPVKLLGRSKEAPKSPVSINVTVGDGTTSEVPLASITSIYPKSATESLTRCIQLASISALGYHD